MQSLPIRSSSSNASPFSSPSPLPEFGPWSPAAAEYHADPRYINHSRLSVFRKSVPLFYDQYITGTLPPKSVTDAMALGTAVHTLLLEPHDAGRIVVMPEFNLRTNAGKEALAAFQAEHEGCLLLTPKQHETAQAMAEAARGNTTARGLMEADGVCEHALRWPDSSTGLPCKARLDKSIVAPAGAACDAIIVDIKTTSDPYPEAWTKTALNYGYHRQAAFYQTAWLELYGVAPDVFIVAIGKSAPYETVTYKMSENFLRMGREENAFLLMELADRIEANDWSSRYEESVLPLEPPRWALRESTFVW